MIRYVLRRLGTMALTLVAISVLVFLVINLPPGNYLSNEIADLRATGQAAGIEKAAALLHRYSFDRPVWQQYLIWIGVWPGPDGFSGLIEGNLGWSFELRRPVADVVGELAGMTALVNLVALGFVYLLALPLGAIAAVRANTWVDYLASLVGYVGLATPNFLLALILLFYGAEHLGLPVGGLMAPEYERAPMSLAKAGSVAVHLIVPVVVIGTSAAAAVMRRLRANLLDELYKPYVETAKARGVPPVLRVWRYPLRMALNPFVSDIGNLAPHLVSGSVMISVVMSLPTLGPILLQSLRSQDIFMSGFILLFVSALTLLGMLISDILLALLDPRIRMGQGRR